MWLVPLFALLLSTMFNPTVHAIVVWLVRTGPLDDTTSFVGLSVAGARSLLETLISMNVSF